MPSLHRRTIVPASVQDTLRISLDLGVELAIGRRWGLRTVRTGPLSRTEGVIGDGETVTWAVRLLGVAPLRHTSLIGDVRYDAPGPDGPASASFVDSMLDGTLAAYRHLHLLHADAGGSTVMTDDLRWRSPLGLLGRVADVLFVRRLIGHLLDARNAEIVRMARAAT